MVQINFKKLIKKKKLSSVVQGMIMALDTPIAILDNKGIVILGEKNINLRQRSPIQVAGKTIGWVTGSKTASSLLANMLSYIARAELDKKSLAIEMLDKYEEINFLYELSGKLANCLGIEQVIKLVVDEAQKLIEANNVLVMLINEETGTLEILSEQGQEHNQKTGLRLGFGIAGHVMVSGQPEIVNDVLSDPRYVKRSLETRSLICAPLTTQKGTIGVIEISNSKPTDYTAQDLKLFSALASQAAAALENALLYKQLKDHLHNLEEKVASRTAALEKANQELHRLANLDGLTQVANRRRFDQYLQLMWERHSIDIAPLSLILCDVDFFKSYNDSYGHTIGDDCLQRIARAISRAVKNPSYLVARYGGEEFGIILPNTSSRGATYIAETIAIEVEWLQIVHPRSAVSDYVTLSFGVCSTIPTLDIAPEALIAAADEALYDAKRQGRDRVIFKLFNPSCSPELLASDREFSMPK